MRLPQLDESLEIAGDGSFTLWRSVGNATSQPSPVGAFSGRLGEAQLESVVAAAGEAAREGSRTWLVLPDSPVDHIAVDGAEATLGMRDPAEGAWAKLAALLRPLLDELTASPAAAIALELGAGARLVQRGTDTLGLDLSQLTVEAVHWREGSAEGEWSAPTVDGGQVSAGPGWTLDLPFAHGFDLRPGDRTAVAATFAILRDGRPVPVRLVA
jgi:hypothetical protein